MITYKQRIGFLVGLLVLITGVSHSLGNSGTAHSGGYSGTAHSRGCPGTVPDTESFFLSFFDDPSAVPVSFVYDGVQHDGLGGLKVIEREIAPVAPIRKGRLVCALDDSLTVTLDAAYCSEFGEVEYTLWFANTGTKPSKTLSNVYAYRATVPGEKPRLRGILGDHQNFYAAYDSDLLTEPRAFHSTNGRATHIVFPYFDFVHGNGGTLMALGWAGTWEAAFVGMSDGTHVMAKTCIDLNAAILPGERIRTGLVVLLPYEGRDANRATNRWRAWFMKYNLPKANAKGEAIQPFSTTCFASDTGLPNSDGSISERATTWKRTLDKLAAERMLPDFRWFDAGWYCDPARRSVPSDWWGTIGTWELDTEKWPGSSFRESNEACHALGLKTLVWFEPERVTHLDDLVQNFGYKKEWGIQTGHCITSNIGDDECLAWTLGRITKMLGENAVDLYREDNNSNPAQAWQILDARDTERLHLPRKGINENKCIQGHYKLWDGIIDFCAKHGKCTYVDSCASGGGRNDIESMRRGVPFMRSDYDRTTIPMRLSQTWGFCKWIPFHGSSTKDTVRQLEEAKGGGSDAYVVRASFLPIYNFSGMFSHNPDLDFDLMRRNYAEWKSVRHLLTRDYYTLTPWHDTKFQEGWTALAYDAPELGESIVLAFRMVNAEKPDFFARLPFADPATDYTLTDADSGNEQHLSGWELQRGLKITLPQKRSSALIRMKRNPAAKPVICHDLAKTVSPKLADGKPSVSDANGGTWSFLYRKEICAGDGDEMRAISGNVGGGLLGFHASATDEFPQVLANPLDDWLLVPGVAGGRKDRPFKPLEFLAHPAPADFGKCRAVIRYTAEKAGTYNLFADFRAMNAGNGKVDISIVMNGRLLWQKELVRNGKTYVELPPLALKDIRLDKGEHLELVVGPGLDEPSHTCDGTGVSLLLIEQ
ncbi:MAG: alpha-galactosidase [Kiritimatiellae bacterium]|nr:alpha-galactosidase [Kiritimatiellia bacterium]